MKKERKGILLPAALLLCGGANAGVLPAFSGRFLFIALCCLGANLLPLLVSPSGNGIRMGILCHGNSCLKLFALGTAVSVPLQMLFGIICLPTHPWRWLVSVLICTCVLALIF